jgi:hypothetical protein
LRDDAEVLASVPLCGVGRPRGCETQAPGGGIPGQGSGAATRDP